MTERDFSPRGFEAVGSELEALIQGVAFDEVIETGTHLGTGSTRVFAATGKPVFSIESCRGFYEQAVENLRRFANVSVINGYSLRWDDLFQAVFEYDETEFDVPVDGGPFHRNFYLAEILGFGAENPKLLPDDLLPKMIRNHRSQLVFLDSAGGVGYREFRCVFDEISENGYRNKTLLLDDCEHVKHRKSVEFLRQTGGYELTFSPSGRTCRVALS